MIKRSCLTQLQTPLGVRNIEGSVAFCNRCGICLPSCPTYQATKQEPFSPRGRNQSFRFLLDGKFHPRRQHRELDEVLRTCSLCGRCTQSCPGKIPTAEHMLEMRRRLGISLLPKPLYRVLQLRAQRPVLFKYLMHVIGWCHRVGLWSAILPGFSFIKQAQSFFPAVKQPSFKPTDNEHPNMIYLPSWEATFLGPDLARQTYHLAGKKHRVCVWENRPSGLLEYIYGDLRRARQQVRLLITRHAQTGNGNLPLLTDSIDVYQFFKKAPQLFDGFSRWEQKAARFAQSVCFVTDILPKKHVVSRIFEGASTFLPTCFFDAGAEPLLQSSQILRTQFKKNFVQCGYKDTTIAPAGYGFVCPETEQAQALQTIRFLAEHQIKTVFVGSGLTKLHLQACLRRFYPQAKVYHIVELDK